MTTFKSVSTSGTSSSKASSLFDLNQTSRKSILVYRYRSGAKGLEITTECDLCAELDNGESTRVRHRLPRPHALTPSSPADPSLPFIRVTRKPIPRGNSRLDISNEDLLLPDERERLATRLPPKVSVANVGLPTMAKWKHLILGSFAELYIVHRGHSPTPDSSANNSPESSQQISPASTFPTNDAHPPRNPDA